MLIFHVFYVVCSSSDAFWCAASSFGPVKHLVKEPDKERFTYSYTIVEGDALMGTL